MAEIILNENKEYVGNDIATKAIKEIKNKTKKGEETNDESQKTTTRGRKKKSIE